MQSSLSARKTLAFYLRLSDEDEDLRTRADKIESYSIGNQRKLLRDYYDSHPQLYEYEVIEFCDDGFSGMNFDRPHFQQMMECVRKGEISCIIVKDLSRFGREYLEVGAYLELILPLFKTRFISVNDGFDSEDYAGTTGGFELALRNLINGMYSLDISMKIRSANRVRFKQGKYWGGSSFYGYNLDPSDKHKIVVDESVRPILLRIFNECADGTCMSEIARRLNEDGVPSPLAYKIQNGGNYNGRVIGKPIWLQSTLRRILSDERYTGKMVCGTREPVSVAGKQMRSLPKDQWIIVEGTHEPIISKELFERAAESRRRRIRTVNKNTAGSRDRNIFVCGCCGHKLQRSVGRGTRLFCPKARNLYQSPCSDVSVDEEHIKTAVGTILKKMMHVLIQKVDANQKTGDRRQQALTRLMMEKQKRKQSIQNGKLALYEQYREGQMTRECFIKQQYADRVEVERLDAEIRKIRSQVETEKRKREREAEIKGSADAVSALEAFDPLVIKKLVSEVKVYPDNRIEIKLRNREIVAPLLSEAVFDTVASI